MPLDDAWVGLVDDAAVFPPGDAPLAEALTAYDARSAEDGADLVGTFVLRDTDLPLVRDFDGPLSVIVTGGAGQLAGPVGLCARLGLRLAGLEIAVRDLDDPIGNVRRIAVAVEAARHEGQLAYETPVFVEIPHTLRMGTAGDAIEVLLEHDFRLKIRTGGADASAFPRTGVLCDLLDLQQAMAIAFKCTAGLHRAVRHTDPATGFEHHGFLNLLMTVARYWAGATVAEAGELLDRRDGSALAAEATGLDLTSARRWFTSFGSCSIAEPWADLRDLGLVS